MNVIKYGCTADLPGNNGPFLGEDVGFFEDVRINGRDPPASCKL
jgi:hypothetical protein